MTVLIEKTKIKSIASRVRSSQIVGDWIRDYTHALFNFKTIDFGSNHSGSSLHLNSIMNYMSSVILDMDYVCYFSCSLLVLYRMISGL